jgi:hypothetical protein
MPPKITAGTQVHFFACVALRNAWRHANALAQSAMGMGLGPMGCDPHCPRARAGNVALIAVLSLSRTGRREIDNPGLFNFVGLTFRKAGNFEHRSYLNRAPAACRNLIRDFDGLVEILCVYQE